MIRPAREVGGDFCDCFLIGDHKAGLVIADVSDKGLSAAMFMMLAKSKIRNEMQQGRTPGVVMERVNAQLAERNEADMFVTVWLAEIDLETGECVSVNAGHENPVLRRAGGQWSLQKTPHDMPAGIEEGIGYTERKLQLYDGDMLFVYTDGVTDAVNAAGEHFGEERIPAALDAGSSDAKAVIDGLFDVLSRYADGAEQFDDIGMICFRYQNRKTGNGENQL
jgi:sigma-B regulation protein RsbU (phosphoserine phosphatase)